jgi:hypothetical protein
MNHLLTIILILVCGCAAPKPVATMVAESIAAQPPRPFSLAWESESGIFTGIESSTDLIKWQRETTFVSQVSNKWTDLSPKQNNKFYRAFNEYQ